MLSRVLDIALVLSLVLFGLASVPVHADTLLTIDEAQLIADGEATDGELYKMEFKPDTAPEYEFKYLRRAAEMTRNVEIDAMNGDVLDVGNRSLDADDLARLIEILDAVPDPSISFQEAADAALAEVGRGDVVEIKYDLRSRVSLMKVEIVDGLDMWDVIVASSDGEILHVDGPDDDREMINFVEAVLLAEGAVRGGVATEGELSFDSEADFRVYTIRVLDPGQMLARVLTYSQLTGDLMSDRTDPTPIENFMRLYDFIGSANFGLAESAVIAGATCRDHPIVTGILQIRDGGLYAVFEHADGADRPVIAIDTTDGEVLRNDCADDGCECECECCDDDDCDDDCDDDDCECECECCEPGLNPGLVRAINAAERECPDGDVLYAEFVTGDGRARYDVDVLALEPARIKMYQIKPGSKGTVLDESERRVTDDEAPLLRSIYNLLPGVVLTWEDALIRARETYRSGQPRSIGLDVSSDTLVYRVGIRQGNRTVYVLVDAATGRAGVLDEVLAERARVGHGAAHNEDLELDTLAGGNGLQTTYRTDRGVLVYLDFDAATGRWFATIINDRGDTITEEAESDAFEDRKNGRKYVTVTTNAGFVLIDPEQDASNDRNITDELPGATPIVEKQTTLITKDDLVVVAGLDYNGDLVAYFQTREVRGDGEEVWAYVNLSRDHLAPQGLDTPVFVDDLVGYVTPWNGLNIAGLNADGDIMAAWWAPGMELWYLSNLSKATGAAPMAGGLTVFVTPWGGINLAGLDANGEVVVTWWAPGLKNGWEKNNLSRELGHNGFTSGQLTSYVTPWGGTNIAGIDDDGRLAVYWWSPGMSKWVVSPLSSLVQGAILPVGELTASTTPDGLINLLGFSEDGDLIRYHWQPGGEWNVENASELLEPMR